MSTSTTQTTVLGFSISEGVSQKTGKAYSIGKLFVMYPLTGSGVGGFMGAELQAEPMVLRKLEGVQMPCEVNIESANVMQWGTLRQQIMSLSPIGQAKPAKAA